MFAAVPLLALPVLVYNVLVLTMAGGFGSTDAAAKLSRPLFSFAPPPGGLWAVSTADILIGASLVVMFVEMLKSTASRRMALVNHSLSALLFVVCLVELLLSPAFATSTFALITLMVLLDVLAGFIVTIAGARAGSGG